MGYGDYRCTYSLGMGHRGGLPNDKLVTTDGAATEPRRNTVTSEIQVSYLRLSYIIMLILHDPPFNQSIFLSVVTCDGLDAGMLHRILI